MWIARNKDGELGLYSTKPGRYEQSGDWSDFNDWLYIDPSLFPDLKWEDEPLEVKLFTDKQIECLENDAYERGWDSCSEMEAEFEESL